MTIRVLLIDDHTLFRSGVKLLLQRQPDFEVVDEASDGVEGVKRAKRHQPDVILLDLNMPGLSGLETLQLLVQDVPSAHVVILTVSEDAEELTTALRDGACGFLVKNIDAETLVAGIRKAAAGEPVIAESMTAKWIASLRAPQPAARPAPAAAPAAAHASVDPDQLTPREHDIVRALARGTSNKEIAREFDVAESTVKIHVQNILKKLNLTSRVQIAVYAVERGLTAQHPAEV
ncbi:MULTISPECIES: response regulator [Burkholderia]|uniref:XRE family transcriptional regulator n=1 Tax=Burkholderia savannae TaxID=1637837 RepID=A0ABR5TDF3_9BURK|nr:MULTISPECIES: response regulator [Burkholderia]AOJ68336.1 XRE family transcriptional regulator [Burkholderia savannae]AOJ80391.1 XRE family transcriptional regulator [Burkholderia savannae]AOK46610.1 XRE family transcriptional regulator [Burkholderia sp. MSMB617WGS]KGS00945.1 bacterial regulatory s, luxR family protein [Burkholderia sp. ABCPW 111]KVG41906.1 XRE family transcriptional regulator [Burkholderia sp. MSMB0265]